MNRPILPRLWILCLAPLTAVSTSAQDGDDQPSKAHPFPGIVVDRAAGTVEVAGSVCIDSSLEDTPEVIVEVVAEAGGVRDHEALITLDAPARHVHAALLLLGLEPGEPGLIGPGGERVEPTGPRIGVAFRFERDGETLTEDPSRWVLDLETQRPLSELGPVFVFGGSSEQEFEGQPVYMAQAEGAVVGLCTFGTGDAEGEPRGVETVGMIPVLSPDTGSDDPIWVADPARLPPVGTAVTLVLSAPPTEG